MPPKPKFTKEEIINSAYELVRLGGENALTAREVGKSLGTSSSPIFTFFSDMEELKSEVQKKAKSCFDAYMAVAENYNPAYKMRGMQWVKFAREEPMLFNLLFMQKSLKIGDFDEVMDIIPFGKEDDIKIIMRDYHADHSRAEHLFKQMWIYTYGLCVLSAEGVCSFSDDEIAVQLGEIFRGMIYIIHSDIAEIASVKPAELGSDESNYIQAKHPDLSK